MAIKSVLLEFDSEQGSIGYFIESLALASLLLRDAASGKIQSAVDLHRDMANDLDILARMLIYAEKYPGPSQGGKDE